MTIKEFKTFIYENCNRRSGFHKECSYFSMKHQKKKLLFLATKLIKGIPGSSETKKHYNSSLKKKHKIAQQPNTMESANIGDIKSVFMEHSNISHKLSKAIRRAEKIPEVSGAGKKYDSSVYSET